MDSRIGWPNAVIIAMLHLHLPSDRVIEMGTIVRL